MTLVDIKMSTANCKMVDSTVLSKYVASHMEEKPALLVTGVDSIPSVDSTSMQQEKLECVSESLHSPTGVATMVCTEIHAANCRTVASTVLPATLKMTESSLIAINANAIPPVDSINISQKNMNLC